MPDLARVLGAQRDFLAARGIELIYYVPAYLQPPDPYVTLLSTGSIPYLLDYADPARYPGLYNRKSRWDDQHLSSAGADAFSRIFAEDLAQLIGQAGLFD